MSLRDGTRPLFLLILCASLIPFALVRSPISIGFADLVAPVALIYVVRECRSDFWWTFYLALIFGSVAVILATALISGQPVFGPLLTLGFYAKPWVYFFAARQVVKGSPSPYQTFHRIMQLASWALALTISVIAVGYLYTGQVVQGGAGLLAYNQSVVAFSPGVWSLPFKLYGNGQVNTTGGLLVLATPVIIYRLRSSRKYRYTWIVLLLASWVEITMSGSRGALLALSIYLTAFAFLSPSSNHHRSLLKKVVAGFATMGVLAGANAILSTSPKYQATVDKLQSSSGGASLLDVTAGRSDLIVVMLGDIFRSPLVGTSFGDFTRFHNTSTFALASSSPHNQYLGALHKGGLIIGVGFLLLMFYALVFRFRGLPLHTQGLGPPLGLALALGLMPVLDVFTTSQASAAALILLGATRSLADLGNSDQEGSIDLSRRPVARDGQAHPDSFAGNEEFQYVPPGNGNGCQVRPNPRRQSPYT